MPIVQNLKRKRHFASMLKNHKGDMWFILGMYWISHMMHCVQEEYTCTESTYEASCCLKVTCIIFSLLISIFFIIIIIIIFLMVHVPFHSVEPINVPWNIKVVTWRSCLFLENLGLVLLMVNDISNIMSAYHYAFWLCPTNSRTVTL